MLCVYFVVLGIDNVNRESLKNRWVEDFINQYRYIHIMFVCLSVYLSVISHISLLRKWYYGGSHM